MNATARLLSNTALAAAFAFVLIAPAQAQTRQQQQQQIVQKRTGFSSSTASKGGYSYPISPENAPPATGPGTSRVPDTRPDADGNLRPRPAGVAGAIQRHGTIMLSPLAPAQYGLGQGILTSNHEPGTLSPDRTDANKYDFGGIRLFGWEF